MKNPNTDLLRRALAHVEANPLWTPSFSAGVVAMADTEPETSPEDVTDADNRARELLGLTVYEAGRLCDPFNTLDDLRRLVGELCEATR